MASTVVGNGINSYKWHRTFITNGKLTAPKLQENANLSKSPDARKSVNHTTLPGLSKQAGGRRSSAGYFKFHRRLFLNRLGRTQLQNKLSVSREIY